MISVIIPLYNKEAIIERTLRSVLSQDYDDFEVVIVDDGSTDNSLAVVKQTLELLKPLQPVEIIRQENGGPSKARNTGIRSAKGEWIVFLDADDELLPGALKRFSHKILENPFIDFFLAEMLFNKMGHVTKGSVYRECIVNNPTKAYVFGLLSHGSGSCAYRKSILETCHFNEGIRRFEDIEWLLRLYKRGSMMLIHEPSVMFNCNNNEASSPRKNIYEDFVGHISLSQDNFWTMMSHYKIYYREHAHYPQESKVIHKEFMERKNLHLLMMIIEKMKSNKYLKSLLWHFVL